MISSLFQRRAPARSGPSGGKSLVLAALLLALGSGASAPLGSPSATKGGDFVIRYGEEPPSLNPLLPASDTAWVNAFVMECLLYKNPETYEWEPLLADSYRVLERGRVFEFTIRRGARFSDGTPVTAEDIAFSFRANFDARYPTAERRAALESIESVEVLDSSRVRFKAKANAFPNFRAAAMMRILPRHIYEIKEPAGPRLQIPIGSGPYRVETWSEGRSITLVRNSRWWGWQDPVNRGKFNPQRLVFRFVGDDRLAYEMMRRGDLDYVDLTPEQYLKALDGFNPSLPFTLQRVTNSFPTFMNSLAMNLRLPLFQDPRMREALSLVIDRETIRKTFFRGLSDQAYGPWYNKSLFSDPSVPATPFDPARAISLLKEAGWEKSADEPFFFRTVNGKREPLRIEVQTSNRVALRHLTFIQDDAARAGIDLELRLLDRATFTRSLEQQTFQIADVGWGGGPVEFDPVNWTTSQTGVGGLNITGFSDPRVDELREQALKTFDYKDRIPLMQEIYRRVALARPQLFLLNENSTYYAVSKRVGRAKPFFRYDAGLPYMWIKPKARQR